MYNPDNLCAPPQIQSAALPDGVSYFANDENGSHGVSTFPDDMVAEMGKKITIREMSVIARMVATSENEAQELEDVACILEEKTGVTFERALLEVLRAMQYIAGEMGKVGALAKQAAYALNEYPEPQEPDGEFSVFPTARSRKALREKQRVVERAIASCLRQYKIKESTRIIQKRANPRRRERGGRGKKID